MVELVASMLLFAGVMLMLGYANSIFVRTQTSIVIARENSSTFDYIERTLLAEIKSAESNFEVEAGKLRIYNNNGTYKLFEVRAGQLYLDTNKICDVSRGTFADGGNFIKIDLVFTDTSSMHLEVYKPQLGFED